MFLIRSVVILTINIMSVMTAPKTAKDAIGFPENEENPALANKQNRLPVFIPSMCPDNELYYPGDQKDDWICDCRPGYLYHPDSEACWPAYRQGPCGAEKYLMLPKNTVIPICEENPCKTDSMVLFQGKCEKLGSRNICGDTNKFPAEALWVNSTTLNIECLPIAINVFRVEYFQANGKCTLGCKRFIQNKCTPKIV